MKNVGKYARKSFEIEAVQVTSENFQEVADWCQGELRTAKATDKRDSEKYIKVRVHRPLNDRQTKAFNGDWVLFAGTGYKVYTPTAFENCFTRVSDGLEHIETQNRDAVTGEYVTEEYANANPETTVSETTVIAGSND